MDGTRSPPAIFVRNLTKVYGDETDDGVRAVSDLSLDVEAGTVVGILGPNGAGKTTAIKCMLGLVVPTAGEVRIHGIDVQSDTRRAYRRVAAMLEGARNVYWRLSVRENLDFFSSLAGQKRADARRRQDRLLKQLGLAEKADTAVNDLSRGMKQKASLAATLSRGTDVVFLDEPTLGLDVESSLELRRELRRLAEREAMTIVLSSHDMSVVEDVCDRVVIVDDGEIVADDTVENLIDLFRTQSYRLVLDGDVPPSVRERLESGYDASEWERLAEKSDDDATDPDRTRVTVSVADGDRLYELLGVLREAGVSLRRIDSVDPDLTDAFLGLTDRNEKRVRPDRPSVAVDAGGGGDSGTEHVENPEPDGGDA
ncbi:ABC transporter ATP-binding protein [Haloprofundus salilacus]|uniref:ABC transporter ATP-binding protein n=1 Tax=Haloprofundus salilacus TaxID=2876190 RepID=UPI001CCF772A|nr:ABC transporter ATP-binding protein [Haloprofundus salilacus]